MTDYFYKILNGTRAANGGTGEWYAPKGSRPGKWMPPVKPVPCESGYHVVTADQILGWSGTDLWRVEVRGDLVDHGDKWVAESARLVSRVEGWTLGNVRLFGLACAAHVLPVFEDRFPEDRRPRRAIEAGLSGVGSDAARAAAEAAARAAEEAAAWDAEDAARAAAAVAAEATAEATAEVAAEAAAWAASRVALAAEVAEQEWQRQTFSLMLTAPAAEVEATYTQLVRG